jgi:hypothetical protein
MADRESQGPRRSERRTFGRAGRARPGRGQQYLFVGLAILFLIGWIMFRKGCSDRIGRTFGTVTNTPAPDAGANAKPPRPRPRPKKTDPDDW